MTAEPPRGHGASAGLPIGTRVQRRGTGRRTRTGVVMHYEPEHSRGTFPVRWDSGIWEKCDASDVIVLAPEGDDR